MVIKSVKLAVVGMIGVVLLGTFVFGRDLMSYARTSVSSVRTSMKEKVPIEFELQRARDMLEQIIPEMHANIRLIAQEEVELKSLEADVINQTNAIADERARMSRIRDLLNVEQASYQIGERSFDRDQLRADLSRRLARLKESEVVLSSRHRLYEARKQSLAAAIETLENTQANKALLQDKVAALEAQHRLVQTAATAGSGVALDGSKLAQTEKLIVDIKKRLDVAERVMAREARFVQPIDVSPLHEQDLLAEVDEYLGNRPAGEQSVGSMADTR